jgi:hypothetical protein
VVARLPRLLGEVHDAERLRSAPGRLGPARLEETGTRKAA